MTAINRTLLYTFVIFLSAFYRLTNSLEEETPGSSSTAIVDPNETMNTKSSTSTFTPTNSTTVSSTTAIPNNSTNPSVTATTSISTTANTSISSDQSSTTSVDNVRPPDTSSGPGWWLLVALLITIVIVIIAGVLFYYRQQSPYRRSTSCSQWFRECNYRFLRSWRSRDDDADNIILQLEQPEITNGQWPPRISFT